MKKRNLKQSRYGHLYKQVQTTWGDCIYCGQHATQVDHVPALDTVEAMVSATLLVIGLLPYLVALSVIQH